MKNNEGSKVRYHHRDSQLWHSFRQNETIKERFSEMDSSTGILAVAGSSQYVNNAVHNPPATYDDGSDHLAVCRSVAIEIDLMSSK